MFSQGESEVTGNLDEGEDGRVVGKVEGVERILDEDADETVDEGVDGGVEEVEFFEEEVKEAIEKSFLLFNFICLFFCLKSKAGARGSLGI